jgi:hypothetical protein
MAKLLRRTVRLAQCSVIAAGALDRDKAMQIAIDVEPLLHEADVLLTAATIIRRQKSGGVVKFAKSQLDVADK